MVVPQETSTISNGPAGPAFEMTEHLGADMFDNSRKHRGTTNACSTTSGRSDDGGDVRSEVMAVGQRWSSSQRELLPLVVELDRSGAWGLDGARSCAHWVADALDIEISTAREWIRVGLALVACTS